MRHRAPLQSSVVLRTGLKLLSCVSTKSALVSNNENLLNNQNLAGIPGVPHPRSFLHTVSYVRTLLTRVIIEPTGKSCATPKKAPNLLHAAYQASQSYYSQRRSRGAAAKSLKVRHTLCIGGQLLLENTDMAQGAKLGVINKERKSPASTG